VEALSRRRRLLILGICCSSLFIVGLDSTIVNLALPAIRSELGASVSKLQWTIDAYTLVLASLLMVSGSTADRVGRRRTFQAGLVVFGIGSLLCGIAPTINLLILFRMLQAVGGSMLNPVAMSIITNTFTDPRERAQAIGVWGGVVGLSGTGWTYMLILTFTSGVVAQGLVVFAQKSIQIGTIAISQVAQPALAVVWSFLLLSEVVNHRQIAGIAIVVAGLLAFVVLNQRGDRTRRKDDEQAKVIASQGSGVAV